MSMLSSTCSSGTLLLIFCHGNHHFLATFLSFNQLLKEKLHFHPQIDQLLESLVGCQWLGSSVLGPELGPDSRIYFQSLINHSMVHPLGLFTLCPSWFPALLGFPQRSRRKNHIHHSPSSSLATVKFASSSVHVSYLSN